jgi:GTPase involved in cell partitioning and DNA repair
LERYSPELASKKEIVVLNKIDLLPTDERAKILSQLAEELHLDSVITCSGATLEGVRDVLEHCWSLTKS